MAKAATAPQPQPNPEKREDGKWGVKDLNAKDVKRPHEMRDGTVYHLSSKEFEFMPPGHAAVFLVDPTFVVIDDGGTKQNPLPDAEVAQAGRVRMKLEKGQCIATYEELSKTSLLARATRLPGGENFTDKSKHGDLVRFLTENELPESMEDDKGLEGVEETGADGAGQILST